MQASGAGDEFSGRDALPDIAEAAPAGDAVEVGKHAGVGQIEKFLPGKRGWLVHQPRKSELPPGQIDTGRAAGVQNGPLFRARLARRNAVGAVRVRADDYARRNIVRGGDAAGLVFTSVHEKTHRVYEK